MLPARIVSGSALSRQLLALVVQAVSAGFSENFAVLILKAPKLASVGECTRV